MYIHIIICLGVLKLCFFPLMMDSKWILCVCDLRVRDSGG